MRSGRVAGSTSQTTRKGTPATGRRLRRERGDASFRASGVVLGLPAADDYLLAYTVDDERHRVASC